MGAVWDVLLLRRRSQLSHCFLKPPPAIIPFIDQFNHEFTNHVQDEVHEVRSGLAIALNAPLLRHKSMVIFSSLSLV